MNILYRRVNLNDINEILHLFNQVFYIIMTDLLHVDKPYECPVESPPQHSLTEND